MANVNLSVRRTAGNTILYTVPAGQRFVLTYLWLNVVQGRAYVRVTGPTFPGPYDMIGLDTFTVSVPDPPPAVEEVPPPAPEEDSVFHRHRHKEAPKPAPHTETPAPRGMTTSTPMAIAVDIDYQEFPAGTVISLDLDASGGMASAGISGSTST